MYLQKNDYKIRIRLNLLDLLLESIADNNVTANEILEDADKIACDTIETKVSVLYSTDGEYSKTDNQRNGYILSLALSIALYEIYQRADDYEIPEKIVKNFNDAMDALDAIASGKAPIGLDPKRDNNTNNGGNEDTQIQGNGLRRIGSTPKRSHRI